MSDPLSIAAAVIGISGVSMQILQLVTAFGLDWKDAPKEVKGYQAELESLKSLSDFISTQFICNPDFTAGADVASTQSLVDDCRGELDSLLGEFRKYSIKYSGGSRVGWHRLKHAFQAKRTRDAVEDLHRRYDLLATRANFQSALQQNEIHKNIKEMREQQLDTEILDWLSTANFATQISDLLERRVAQTGEWLLGTSTFLEWEDGSDDQILLCQGIPGAGKTMMVSIVGEHLEAKYGGDYDVGYACFFCNFRRQGEQTLSMIFLSILRQLIQQLGSVPDVVRKWYTHSKRRQTRPNFTEISKAVNSAIKEFSRVYISIDALDEWRGDDEAADEILYRELRKLQTEAGARLFITSRVIPTIRSAFNDSLHLEIHAHDEDLFHYVEDRLHNSRLAKFKPLHPKIKAEVVKAAGGMFLLAELHMRHLNGKITRGDIEDALKNLPEGQAGLDATYNQAMERIANRRDTEEIVKIALSWVVYARRPLSTREFLHAISIKHGASKLEEDYIPCLEDMLSFSAGLLTVDTESDVIRLIHYTTQEYFERNAAKWFPAAQVSIARSCITYLSFDSFTTGACATDRDYEARLADHPLYRYFSQNWGYHVRPVLSEVSERLLEFLEDANRVSAAGQALLADGNFPDYSQHVPFEIDGLHLASFFGIAELAQSLLGRGHALSVKDSLGRTPFMWAAKNGHDILVSLFLEMKADLNEADKDGQTALHLAIWKSHVTVVSVLLKAGADTNVQDHHQLNALDATVEIGSRDIFHLLLQSKEEAGYRNDDYESSTTPSPDSEWLWTELTTMELADTLGEAIKNGRLAEVTALLKVQPRAAHYHYIGLPMLYWAAVSRDSATLQAVLDAGADPNAVGKYSQQPAFHGAVSNFTRPYRTGEYAKKLSGVINLFQHHGVNLKTVDKHGWSILHVAARSGDVAGLQVAMGLGIFDIDEADLAGQTPLLIAAIKEHADAVRCLIELYGADPERTDKAGRTALLCAIDGTLYEHEGWMRSGRRPEDLEYDTYVALVEYFTVNVNAEDLEGTTPLIKAVERWGQLRSAPSISREHLEKIIRLLLNSGATVDHVNKCGRTALSYAAERGGEIIVQLLLEHGASQGLQDATERAIRKGHLKAMNYLLQHVEQEGRISETYLNMARLHNAISTGNADDLASVLQKGIDLGSISDSQGLLTRVVKSGHVDTFRLLLEHGISPPARSRKHCAKLVTLYRLAGEVESPEFLRLLLEFDTDNSHRCSCLVVGYKFKDRAQRVLDAGLDVNGICGTSLIEAAEHFGIDMVMLLLDEGADPNHSDDAGFTALHWGWKDPNVARLLIRRGADIEARTKEDKTPLAISIELGHPKRTQLLLEMGADPHNVQLELLTCWQRAYRSGFLKGKRLLRSAREQRMSGHVA